MALVLGPVLSSPDGRDLAPQRVALVHFATRSFAVRRWLCSTSSRSLLRFSGLSSRRPRGSFAGVGMVAVRRSSPCVRRPRVIRSSFSSNLYRRARSRAGAAVPARHRHGDPVADRRGRADGAPEAGRLDGARQAGVRRDHSGHGRVLRVSRLQPVRRSLGRRRRGDLQRRRAARRRLVLVARRGPGRGGARQQAGPGRPVGDLVQELPDDGKTTRSDRPSRRRSTAT